MTEASAFFKTFVDASEKQRKFGLEHFAIHSRGWDSVFCNLAKLSAKCVGAIRNHRVETQHRFHEHGLERRQLGAERGAVSHKNLSLLCVETGKVGAPAAAAKVGRSGRNANWFDASAIMFGTP